MNTPTPSPSPIAQDPSSPNEEEFRSVIQFLDQHLRPGKDWSIANEYPNVFNSQNRANIRVIKQADQVVAHAAIKYLLIKTPLGLFKAAAIGSVYTIPEARGQGHSQRVIQSCLSSANAEGADFAILWTDLYDFYRKLGFELAGTEVSFQIDQVPEVAALSGVRIMVSEKVAPAAILRLYNQHSCGTLRNEEDIKKYLSIPNARVYTAWNAQNELQAYAVEGKGADLSGYVHEWGGHVPALMMLFAKMRKDREKPLTIICPAHAKNLIKTLKTWNAFQNDGYLGMIKILHHKSITFKLNRFARKMGWQQFDVQPITSTNPGGPTEFQITINQYKVRLKSEGELIRFLFGPFDTSELPLEFQKLLPIPMWVWGWDSV